MDRRTTSWIALALLALALVGAAPLSAIEPVIDPYGSPSSLGIEPVIDPYGSPSSLGIEPVIDPYGLR